MLKWLLGGGLNAINGILGRFFPDKDAKEQNAHDEQVAFRHQVAAEAANAPTGKFNSFVDGVNRLVRPFFTYGIVGLFIWAVCDPVGFSAVMAALALIPDPLWAILGTIVIFWFGGRTMENLKSTKIDPRQVENVVASIRKIRELDSRVSELQKPTPTPEKLRDQAVQEETRQHAAGAVPPAPDEQYEAEMADTSKPLSDAAIERWNRENNPQK